MSNQLFAAYARGVQAKELAVILGEASLSASDKAFVAFADAFEGRYIKQGAFEDRNVDQTLDLGWELLKLLPRAELKRVSEEQIAEHMDKSPAQAEEDED